MGDAEDIIAENARPFGIEIAEQARRPRYGFDRTYKLTKVVNGITTHKPIIEVYGSEDQCFIQGDEFPHTAYGISQFDVHGLVRKLLDRTDYVLTYYDEDKLSESQAETVGVNDGN